jgi:phosphopantothenoylcysteine synthetase/decarboxylase
MSQLVGKRITLGVTGSTAAYKAADLTSNSSNTGRRSRWS